MQQTAGNSAVTSLIGSPGDGAAKQSSPAQRAPAKTDVGNRARATGKRAVAAVGSQLGRLAGRKPGALPAPVSFDAVLRGASAGTQTAPVQRAVLEETPSSRTAPVPAIAGGGAAAAGTGAADNWGTGGGMNDKALGGNASGTGAAHGVSRQVGGARVRRGAGRNRRRGGRQDARRDERHVARRRSRERQGPGRGGGGLGGAAGGVFGGVGGASAGLVGGTRGGTGNGFVGGETGAGAGTRASDDTKLAGGGSGKLSGETGGAAGMSDKLGGETGRRGSGGDGRGGWRGRHERLGGETGRGG